MNTHPKVVAAAQGTGAGGALSIILVWGADQVGLDMSPEVAVAFATLISTGFAWIAGRQKKA